MRGLLCLVVMISAGLVEVRAGLYAGLVLGYDRETKVIEVRLNGKKENILFAAESDADKVQALRRVLQLWYMRGSPHIEEVVPLEPPEIKLQLEYPGLTAPAQREQNGDAPLMITLKDWSIRLPIVLSNVTDEKGFAFYVLDDPATAFAGALSAADQKRFVKVDKAEVETYRQKKARWIARNMDIYHFATPGLLEDLAKTRKLSQPAEPKAASGQGSP